MTGPLFLRYIVSEIISWIRSQYLGIYVEVFLSAIFFCYLCDQKPKQRQEN